MKELLTNAPGQCTGEITTVIVGDGGIVTARNAGIVANAKPIPMKAGQHFIGQDINEVIIYQATPDAGMVPADGRWAIPVKGGREPQSLTFVFIERTPVKHEEDTIGQIVKVTKDAQEVRNSRLDAMLTSFGF